jgi:RNA polymerase sigma factor (sigma-70 family)
MMDREALEVAEINLAIKTGGEGYWRKVYHAYFEPLKVFISREFGPLPADIAEDLSYRTLLKLVDCRRKPNFGHKRQLVAWLYKAARCSALDYWKSLEGKARRGTKLVEDADDLFVSVPESAVVEGEDDEQVRQVLAAMTERERLLLTMRTNGTPYSTIAAELGIEENAARTYFDRAKKKFAKQYTERAAATAAR